MPPSDFPSALDEVLRADPGRPLVTFYDDATGERVELSVQTYGNWVSKTAGLVQDELELARGALVLLDLPTHWLGAVWLGACWTGGLCVTDETSRVHEAELVVCGPDGLDRYAGHAQQRAVVALSLRPLGARFADPLPEGVLDYGAVVLAQPDAFVSYDPPGPDDEAWRTVNGSISQHEMLESAAARPVVGRSGRLLTDVNPCTLPGRDSLLSPLLQHGSAVWVVNPEPSRWEGRYAEERATALLRSDPVE